MATIVLVPGAFHGAWYFSPILAQLRGAGHDVHAITLTGLGGPEGRTAMPINLDTHIEDVVSYIELEKLENVILCGHSYAGLVIAGASDRLPGRIDTLLFVDALVPENGESVWSTWPPHVREMFVAASADGLVTATPPGVDPRARAHPLATFLQPVRFTGAPYDVQNKVYALCAADENSLFLAIHDRVAAQPRWKTHQLASGHDIMNHAPELLLDLLLETAAR